MNSIIQLVNKSPIIQSTNKEKYYITLIGFCTVHYEITMIRKLENSDILPLEIV